MKFTRPSPAAPVSRPSDEDVRERRRPQSRRRDRLARQMRFDLHVPRERVQTGRRPHCGQLHDMADPSGDGGVDQGDLVGDLLG
jgi:hypothetical protein